MSETPVVVPDYLPAELQQAYGQQARHQVTARRHSSDAPPRPHHDGGPLGWLTIAQLPLVAAALAVALLGLTAMTVVWAWLATTHDPMWWAYTGVGAALLGVTAVATGAVGHRSRVLRSAEAGSEAGRAETRPARSATYEIAMDAR